MAFTIPNAVDTVSGSYSVLDQAEPDSLDFEILGNSAHTGVIYGGVVSDDPGSDGVSVTAGVAVHQGVPYPFQAVSFNLTPGPSDPRFDLVVVDVSAVTGGYATVTHLSGSESATNPEFPRSKSVEPTGVYDPTKHVPLASVYRIGGAVTSDKIVDKRSIVRSYIAEQGTTAPLSTTAQDRTGIGSLYYKTGTPEGSQSGVYVKGSSGGWIELAQNVGPHVPIGGMLLWPSTGAVPTGFLEAKGQSLTTTDYPALFNVLGYTWGGSGTSFTLPDFREKFVRGTGNTNATAVGTTVGADSITLTSNQMPSHSHAIAHNHTLNDHAHSIGHGHGDANSTTGGDGAHAHNYNESAVNTGNSSHNHNLNAGTIADNTGTHNHSVSTGINPGQFVFYGHKHGGIADSGYNNLEYVFDADNQKVVFAGVQQSGGPSSYYTTRYYWEYANSNSGVAAINTSGSTNTTGGHKHTVNAGGTNSTGGHNHGLSLTMQDAATHTHTLGVPAAPNTTNSGDNKSTTSIMATNYAANTSSQTAGGNASFDNRPAAAHARWIIRASYGSSATAVGGTSLLDEALEEVVTIELAENGANLANGDVAYYRMPWGATLRDVRAARNSGNMTSATTITITGSSSGTITSDLVIDAGESSSTTATAPTIGVTDLDDDEVLTFNVSGATTTDTGPLVVTLYMYRDA
jgi:microcystin-dependent protein